MDGFPSGQREQTVNLPSQTSVVRIHPHPPLHAGMAELADAYGSGPYAGNSMQVQVLFPAPNGASESLLRFSFVDILDNREYTLNTDTRYSRIEELLMPREKFRTLTEQMFYVLLCLKDECYGMDILDKVPAMTNKRVNVGSGTLYNLLEQFLEAKMIEETKVEGRRRSYILTEKGRKRLEMEYHRICAQAEDYRRLF